MSNRFTVALPRRRRSALSAALLLAAAFAAACTQPKAEQTATPGPAGPDHAEINKTVTATAKVVSVDKQTRVIVLRNEKGETLRVRAGEEVRNFAQINAGDTVRADYQVSLAVALQKPDEKSPDATLDAAVGRAPVGATPAGAVGAQMTVTVRIESVDTKNNIVVFTPPGGEIQAAEVRRPEGREFIKGLKPGDRVKITYTEALAVSLEKQ